MRTIKKTRRLISKNSFGLNNRYVPGDIKRTTKKIFLGALSSAVIIALIFTSFPYVQEPLSKLALISNKSFFVSDSSIVSYVSSLIQKDVVVSNDYNVDDEEKENTTTEDMSVPEPLIDENITQPAPQPETPTEVYAMNTTTDVPTENVGEVVRKTLSASSSTMYVPLEHGFVKNLSGLPTQEVLDLANAPMPFTLESADNPQVLIYHTHATESFQPFYADWFSTVQPTRNTDNALNMVAVGDVVTNELQKQGINVIHATEQHDNPSYTQAYGNSHDTITKYLQQYPSIKVVLDLHRDAIQGNSVGTAPATEIDGVKMAQIMIISCADNGKGRIPNFRSNFTFASKLQNQLESDYPTLTRPILFDNQRYYNQDLSTGALLVEFGSHVSTLEEAKNSAVCFGKSLSKVLLQN